MSSITPNCRIIGTREICIAKNPMAAATIAIASAGARCSVTRATSTRGAPCTRVSSSKRECIWIAKSTPMPMRMGRPEIVTRLSGIPMKPMIPNVATVDNTTHASERSLERTRKTKESTTIITSTASPPRDVMPPCR